MEGIRVIEMKFARLQRLIVILSSIFAFDKHRPSASVS